MGQQIILQPNGKLSIYSSVVDDFIVTDATDQHVKNYYATIAARDAREKTRKIIEALRNGYRPYQQFTITFEEACLKTGWKNLEEATE
jgi:hypothetical protein